MKKKIIFSFLLLTILALFVGCGKKSEETETELGNNKVGGWELILTDTKASIPEEASKAFKEAFEGYVGLNVEEVALLGTQVVAGTNYMFLCKGTPVVAKPTTSYKVAIVYKDLEGKSKVSEVKDFDIANYANSDNDYKGEKVTGGWSTEFPAEGVKLEDKIQNLFDNTAKKMVGISYSPIAVLGKQIVSGTNYAVLAYGKLSTADATTGVYLLTLNEDLKGNQKVVSSSYIDLADFNN
jgi:hypothetical protein